jgi:hypothetical protein
MAVVSAILFMSERASYANNSKVCRKVAGVLVCFTDTGDGSDTDGQTDPTSNHIPDPAHPREVLVYTWTFACQGNDPGTDANNDCGRARKCSATPDYELYWKWQAEVSSTGARGEWQRLPGDHCLNALPAEPAAPDIALLAQNAFRHVKFAHAATSIQPPNNTLVNLDTFYSTNIGPQLFQVPILGIPVRIKAIPTAYTWHFGDGSSRITSTPGKPYPHGDVIYRYQSIGTVKPYVTITYRGQFAVPNGQFVDIPGAVTIDGPATALAVHEARSQLVSGQGPSEG